MRRRRFLVAVHGVTAVAHVPPTLAWATLVPWWIAAAGGAALWWVTARRIHSLLGDPPRSRWVVRLIDQPLFWHWGAGVMALPLMLLGGLLLSVLTVGGCGPASITALPSVSSLAVASFGAGLVIAGWSLWGRRRFVQIRHEDVPIAGLHADFDGYRVVHLSDLHIGSHDPRERGLTWAAAANALSADLVAVTGDLVTSGTAYYDDVADVLAALDARDGVFVCMGNHDQWDNERLTTAIRARGPNVLRNSWVEIRRGEGQLVLAGLDDAYTEKNDLDATLAGRPEGTPTLLLAHYPSFFSVAAERGVALVLSGHTHGGQFGVPFLSDRWNLARALGQRGRGLFRSGASWLHVSAGLGTTGPPMRLGVAPEITVITLRAAPVV